MSEKETNRERGSKRVIKREKRRKKEGKIGEEGRKKGEHWEGKR